MTSQETLNARIVKQSAQQPNLQPVKKTLREAADVAYQYPSESLRKRMLEPFTQVNFGLAGSEVINSIVALPVLVVSELKSAPG